MSIVTWKIVNMERTLPDGDVPPEGQIFAVHWTATLEDQGESVSSYGSAGLGAPDPNNYVPFEDITETMAINWLKETLGSEQVTAIEDSLASQLQQKLNPTSASGLPW